MTQADLLREVMVRRLSGRPGLASGRQVRRWILELLQETGACPGDIRAFWADPSGNLGPFRDLPARVREDLRASALHVFQESRLVSDGRVRFLAHGPLASLGGRVTHWGWVLKGRGRTGAGDLLLRGGRRLQRDAMRLARNLQSRIRFSSRYKTPFAAGLWAYCGCRALPIIEEYVEGIPVDPQVSPIYLDPIRNQEAALLLGIDALNHQGSFFFLESNMNPGMRPGLEAFYDGTDPIGAGLARYASSQGHEVVEYFAVNVENSDMKKCFPMEMEALWAAQAAEAGVELSIVDAPNMGSPFRRRRSSLPGWNRTNTLVVYGRDVPSPMSRILGTKGLVERLLRSRKLENAAADAIQVPREILDSADLPPVDASSRFPNLIVKEREVDRGEGLSLYKVDTLPEDIDWDRASPTEFVVSDPVKVERNGIEREHVSHFRVWILLTARGPFYLASRKNISGTPVPESLAWGKMEDLAPYISNLNLGGGWFEAPSAEENELCEAFALALGQCLLEFYRTRQVPDLQVRSRSQLPAPVEPVRN
ncbi:MAG: hypothetical protein R6T96_08110 [Longimicrobiales bacterium]